MKTTTILILQFVALLGLLSLSAFFSGTEVALFSLNKIQIRRIRQKHPRRGEVVMELLEHPHRLLSTILMGNVMVNIGASIIGYAILRSLYPEHAELIAIPILTIVLLLFGEVTPKSVMIQNPEYFAVHVAGPIRWMIQVTTIIRHSAEAVSSMVIRLIERLPFFARRKARSTTLTEAEYQTLLGVSERAGVLQREERVMVNKILALAEMQVKEIMTPRVDIQFVNDAMGRDEIVAALRKYKHRRVPVYHESPDNIVGVLNAKDCLAHPDRPLAEMLDQPKVVPGTMSAAKLLKVFRLLENPVAIVVDEHGGTHGMVTLEDVAEEIVGEIEDEFDTSEIMIQRVNPNCFIINGKARVEFVNEQCSVSLEAEEGVDTIAGLLIRELDSLPREGESTTIDGVTLTAHKVAKHRVREVKLEIKRD